MQKILFSLCLMVNCVVAYGQAGGNAIYGNGGYRKSAPLQNNQLVYINDSTIKITAKVLMNFDADRYIAVWGLQEEGETPEVCNQKLEKRISDFGSKLKSQFSVNELYVDMVSQSPIFNHDIAGKVITQKQIGFELKKNLIHTFANIEQIDEMLMLAASLEIYDLVKVDYIVDKQMELRQKLFAEAAGILEQKKQQYGQLMGIDLAKPMAIHSENFYLVSPLVQYETYTANESSSVHTSYNSDYVRKQARKRSTSYYDGISGNAYDKIINPAKVKVGMQAVMELSVVFRVP